MQQIDPNAQPMNPNAQMPGAPGQQTAGQPANKQLSRPSKRAQGAQPSPMQMSPVAPAQP